jgi:hypothetical protein
MAKFLMPTKPTFKTVLDSGHIKTNSLTNNR